jgi:hypothetical protein
VSGTVISGATHAQLLKVLGRTEPFKNGDEFMAALTDQAHELAARKRAAEMQETGRRLAAERREREAAEEAAYPDQFRAMFGEPARQVLAERERTLERAERKPTRQAPPANEDEEYRRDFERLFGMKVRG